MQRRCSGDGAGRHLPVRAPTFQGAESQLHAHMLTSAVPDPPGYFLVAYQSGVWVTTPLRYPWTGIFKAIFNGADLIEYFIYLLLMILPPESGCCGSAQRRLKVPEAELYLYLFLFIEVHKSSNENEPDGRTTF